MMRVRFAGSSAGLRPRSIALVLSALILVPAFSNGGELARVVSMVSLIAEPEHYNGQRVMVTGYARFGSEESMIFLNPYDSQEFIAENSIFLDTAKSDRAKVRRWRALFDHETIVVEGTFYYPTGAKPRELWTGYPNGIITDITDMRLQNIHPELPNDIPAPKR